ncbi:hypothetical protein LXL04_037037 [Taraxacum kok-saghyz]
MIKHCGGPAVVRRWSGGGASVVQCADGCRWCTDGGPAVVRWWVQVVVRWVQVVVRWSLIAHTLSHSSLPPASSSPPLTAVPPQANTVLGRYWTFIISAAIYLTTRKSKLTKCDSFMYSQESKKKRAALSTLNNHLEPDSSCFNKLVFQRSINMKGNDISSRTYIFATYEHCRKGRITTKSL